MSNDSVDRKVVSLVCADVGRAYGLPGHLRPGRNGDPLVTHCAGCGADADDVGVDPHTELCDECTEKGVTWLD